MTEKRFVFIKCIENNWGIVDRTLEDTDQLILVLRSKTTVKYIFDLLNQYSEENKQLKEVLKKQYINEICETCKYGDYFEICLIGEPTEYDFECEKGHDDCCDITECEDYELKDIEEFKQ